MYGKNLYGLLLCATGTGMLMVIVLPKFSLFASVALIAAGIGLITCR
ncbi:MAG: hypothetical protein KHZ62_03450 [Clostridiales bacterium]|nr:hypothetical protein [Clostridiales bacterium]